LIFYYKTIESKVTRIEKHEKDCWINCIAPNEREVEYLMKTFDIESDFLRAALDEEESSHIDSEHGKNLIIIDIPVGNKEDENVYYSTIPLGIIVTETNVITVCLKDNSLLSEISKGIVKNVYTNLRTNFVLKLMLRMATKYLQHLKQIDKITEYAEKELRKSMKNKELIQLLEVQKSLVYFSAALKANEGTLEKIMRGRIMKLYEDDRDLLEDVLIEIKQAIEMSGIYLNILTGTMDAFGSIISNNLNIIMKFQASLGIILSMPAIISGIYGMNMGNQDKVKLLPFADHLWFPFLIMIITMIISWILLKKKDMF